MSVEQLNVQNVGNDKTIETFDELAVKELLEIQLIYGIKDKRIQKSSSRRIQNNEPSTSCSDPRPDARYQAGESPARLRVSLDATAGD